MSAIEFTAQSGKTFSLQLYNATTLAAIGTPLVPTGVGGIYRVSTGANAGIVYVEATATNLLVAGFANLDSASADGYSPLRDTYDEAATPLAGIDSSLDEAKGTTFDTTTDSLEAIRNRGDAAWTGGASASITVVPLTGVVEERVNGTTLTVFIGETLTLSVPCIDAQGEAVDLTGLTLELVIARKDGTNVAVIENADITKSGSTFTFAVPSAASSSVRELEWALRKSADQAVLMRGVWSVNRAAKRT